MADKILSKQITSYDLLKTFAVILMIIDHIGGYFFPDVLWLRVIGRMCVPVWLFLIGYARSRDVSPHLWIGAFVLVGADVVVGWPIFSLNILFTVLCIRLVLDRVVVWFEKSEALRFGVALGMVALFIPTVYLTDYGTSGLALAMYGYYVRRYQERQCSEDFMRGVMVFSLVFFVVSQQLCHGFSSVQFVVLAGGILVELLILQFFVAREFTDFNEKAGVIGRLVLRLCGRYSLEIFVVHLVVLKVVVLLFGDWNIGLFQVKFFPSELFS